jgi:hypothetical protein
MMVIASVEAFIYAGEPRLSPRRIALEVNQTLDLRAPVTPGKTGT